MLIVSKRKIPTTDYRKKKKSGVDDGTRTHDDRNHNPGLYQLSYAHHSGKNALAGSNMARPAGLEPATLGLEGRCSIQMSYGRISEWAGLATGRGRGIRTPDILLPKQARYQTALYPASGLRVTGSMAAALLPGSG